MHERLNPEHARFFKRYKAIGTALGLLPIIAGVIALTTGYISAFYLLAPVPGTVYAFLMRRPLRRRFVCECGYFDSHMGEVVRTQGAVYCPECGLSASYTTSPDGTPAVKNVPITGNPGVVRRIWIYAFRLFFATALAVSVWGMYLSWHANRPDWNVVDITEIIAQIRFGERIILLGLALLLIAALWATFARNCPNCNQRGAHYYIKLWRRNNHHPPHCPKCGRGIDFL